MTSAPPTYSSIARQVSERRHSTSVLSSARRKWITWFSISALPKALRWRVYSMVSSIIRSSEGMPLAAAQSRSSWNCSICMVKPMPRWPTTLRFGTRTSSKKSCAVSDEFMPILWIFCLVMPGLSIGTMISDFALWGAASASVLTSRQHQSALSPLVIHIFWPLITKSSPSSRA